MTAVKAINLVLPEVKVYPVGSSICGQLVLNLSSTLVDPVVKMELMGRGYLKWPEGNPELEYEEIIVCTNKAVYISKAKKFHIAGKMLEWGATATATYCWARALPLPVERILPVVLPSVLLLSCGILLFTMSYMATGAEKWTEIF